MVCFHMEWRQIQGTSTTSSMTTEQNNHVLTAINAAIVSFTQQIVEQATKPLVERIRKLELDAHFSRQEQATTSIDIAIASVKQDIIKEVLDIMDSRAVSLAGPINKFDVIRANVLDAVDEKIEEAISKITTDSIAGFSEAVEEVLQNQPPLNADDIDGLRSFVEGVIEESDSDLERTIREEVENQIEQNDPVEKIKQALRDAADSL